MNGFLDVNEELTAQRLKDAKAEGRIEGRIEGKIEGIVEIISLKFKEKSISPSSSIIDFLQKLDVEEEVKEGVLKRLISSD